ncbi:hypothetical protein [Frateuria aurantia]|uniref:Uncharacterized protein n=1 Tax=Frateuria aurantia (strain ATCC 33424 / DSM 6220 / KCTC 2777 / LMG 1558 / NBRC 3245 / NCIMB 13370) TaxID=767434 RepID=H8L1U0_FRAAD|nr:hypothetical protein [Frateuria aurantia]AFC86351.1 hypothetical protein Fraau_1963 [Frateuria aurantia DSM 6220]
MNVNYFGYYLHDHKTNKDYQIDLSDLFDSISNNKYPDINSNLYYNGDRIYPLPYLGSTYLLIQSRDNELIKFIERATLKHEDLSTKLGTANSVGMASYVKFEPNWIAIVSKVLSPRIQALSHIINHFIRCLGSDLEFKLAAFNDKVSKKDIVKLNHVSSISIGLNASSSLTSKLVGTLLGNGYPATSDIGGIEIRLKPSSSKSNLKKDLQNIAINIPDSDIDELDARGKIEATDRMRDLYIHGSGGLKDFIRPRYEHEIPSSITKAASLNTALQAKIKEFSGDPNYIKTSDPHAIGLNW